MRFDGKKTWVHIGKVIDWIFKNGISVDALRNNTKDQANKSED